MFGVTSTEYGDFPEEVFNEREALPIVTSDHSPRCPYCSSPRCLHLIENWRVFLASNKVDVLHLRLCKCRRYYEYFIVTDNIPKTISDGKIMCQRCGSRKLIERKRYKLRRRVSRDKLDKYQIILFGDAQEMTLSILLCRQCKSTSELTIGQRNGERVECLIYTGLWNEDAIILMHRLYYDDEIIFDISEDG